MRSPTKIEHALAVINLYFSLQPKYWIYEPVEKFSHLGKDWVWSPDCIFVHQKKVYVCEVQRKALSRRDWARKWNAFNVYFNHRYFESAAFQKWSSKTIFPQFLVITGQNPEIVMSGFEIRGRELIVSSDLK